MVFPFFFIAILLTSFSALTEESKGNSASISSPSAPKENKYTYDSKDIPNIHFFPVEKARWNGYELRAREWHQLPDFLKRRFLQGARTEIEVHENAVVLVNSMDRLVRAMDESLKEVLAEPGYEEMSVMKFFYIMLLQHDAIKKAHTIVKLKKEKKAKKA